MRKQDIDFVELVELLYAAAGDAAGWTAFLDRLAQTHGGSGATLLLLDRKSHEYPLLLADSPWLASGYIDSYLAHYGSMNPWIASYMRDTPNLLMRVRHSDELVKAQDFLQSEFFNDWLRPQRLNAAQGIVLLQEEGRAMMLSMLYGESAADAEAATRYLLTRLAPHAKRAAQLHRKVTELQNAAAHASDAFDRVPFAVFFVDASGKVARTNRVADRLLDAGDGLLTDAMGRLRATDARAQERLSALIQGVMQPSASGAGGIVTLPRVARTPLSAMVAPLHGVQHPWWGREDAAGVFINNPDAAPTITAAHLTEAFSLTPAEGRLLWALAAGKRIESYAEEAALSLHTVRGYLKALFQKMDCHTQSDLVRRATGLIRMSVDMQPRR